MPIGYAIDHDARLVRVRAWGVLADGDLTEHARGFVDDPDARLGPRMRGTR